MPKYTIEDVFDAIRDEREYQDTLWGPTATRGQHTITEFLTYIRSYVNEALETMCRVADDDCREPALHGLRKIATLAVAAMQQNGVECRDPLAKFALERLCRRRREGQ